MVSERNGSRFSTALHKLHHKNGAKGFLREFAMESTKTLDVEAACRAFWSKQMSSISEFGGVRGRRLSGYSRISRSWRRDRGSACRPDADRQVDWPSRQQRRGICCAHGSFAMRVGSQGAPIARVLRFGSRRETNDRRLQCRSPRLYSLNWTCRKLARSLEFSISHICRESNVEANTLANRAVRSGVASVLRVGGQDKDAPRIDFFRNTPVSLRQIKVFGI